MLLSSEKKIQERLKEGTEEKESMLSGAAKHFSLARGGANAGGGAEREKCWN